MTETNKNIILRIIICVLLATTVFFACEYFAEVKLLQEKTASQKLNSGVVSFLNLFINKVLQSNTQVSFEDRLQLENSIRSLNDPQLLAQWEKFTSATDPAQIQLEAKNLLALLVKKITY